MAAISSSSPFGKVPNHHLFETSELPNHHFELNKTTNRIFDSSDCLTNRRFGISSDFYKNSRILPNTEKLRYIDEEFIESEQIGVKHDNKDIFNVAAFNKSFATEKTFEKQLKRNEKEGKQKQKHQTRLQTQLEKHKTFEQNNNVYKIIYSSEFINSEISENKEKIRERELLEKITFANEIKTENNIEDKKSEKKKKKRRSRKTNLGDELFDFNNNNELGLVFEINMYLFIY